MDRIIIRGGKPLEGKICISGAKNAALTLLPCALLTDEPLTLRNLPRLADVDSFGHLLNQLGVSTMIEGSRPEEYGRVMTLRARTITSTVAPYDIVRKMRASILVLGPLVARAGEATVSLPGGCAIGMRPIDLHLKALQALGAEIEITSGYVKATAPKGGLVGGTISFPSVSVGATENALMAAVLAKGQTVIENAAREPEITDLAKCLIAMGAHIEGLRTDTLVVEGRDKLHGATYSVMPDRIEAGSYACAALVTGGSLELVGGAQGNHALNHFRAAGRRRDHQGYARRNEDKCQWIAQASHCIDGTLSGLSDGHAGAIHVYADAGAGHEPPYRDYFREPLHARARAQPHGRGY
jgi:UDP-N-acetylglucosamine 1-carboxyvinyltransferase